MKERTQKEFEQFLDAIIEFGSHNNEETKFIIADNHLIIYKNDMVAFTKEKGADIVANLEYVAKIGCLNSIDLSECSK